MRAVLRVGCDDRLCDSRLRLVRSRASHAFQRGHVFKIPAQLGLHLGMFRRELSRLNGLSLITAAVELRNQLVKLFVAVVRPGGIRLCHHFIL